MLVWQFDFELVVHRGENQVDGVEQGLPSYCDVERDVRLCRLRTCKVGNRAIMIICVIEIVEILSWFQFYQKRTNIPDIDALTL